MRVAVVHSFYRSGQPSGENVAVDQQVGALERAGVEVIPIFRHSDDELKRPLFGLRSAARIATGWDGGHLADVVKKARVDVVQVHNTFPNFGTRWLREVEAPVVTTVHNFRFACANGLLFRDGHLCLECPTNGSINALRHKCYQDSLVASLPASIGTAGGVTRNRLITSSDVVITQSRRVHDFMVESGVPEASLAYVPGFVERRNPGPMAAPRSPRFIFVGRHTPEKGLDELMTLWPQGVHLDLLGGEESGSVPENERITFRGRRDRDALLALLPAYTALVFPGLVWEGAYPLVVREALEAGVPVIAREGSGAADLIRESGAGSVYLGQSGDSLQSAVRHVAEFNGELRQRARDYFETALTEARWLAQTIEIYEGSLAARGGAQGG